MRVTFGKGIIIGAVATSVLVLGAPALAGSGVGGVFHLGKTNKVNKTTALVNKGTGPALRLKSRAGAPPLAISNSTKVGKLNADMVDGLSPNQLARLSSATIHNLFSFVSFSTVTTTTVVAPTKGYVLVSGHENTRTSAGTCPCASHLRVRHVQSNTFSPLGLASMATTNVFVSNAMTGVFPVAPGVNVFELQAGGFPGDATISHNEPTITALFVPFDGNGGVTARQQRPAPHRSGVELGQGVRN